MKRVLDNSLPWATFLVYALSILYAVVGAVEVFRDRLSFDDYGTKLIGFAVAAGVLGVGRGIAASKPPAVTATATVEPPAKAAAKAPARRPAAKKPTTKANP